ncbi:MAG: hypothetical protein PUE13_01475, partial [Clostridiales bacterium]|nr:hypothetical protein [Clostridiales bacterium]
YGMVLGAEKSWSVHTEINDDYDRCVDFLLYKKEGATEFLKRLSGYHDLLNFNSMAEYYYGVLQEERLREIMPEENLRKVMKGCGQLAKELSEKPWERDEYREEMLLAAQGLELMAELIANALDIPAERHIDTEKWLSGYAAKWHEKNKESELCEIEKLFRGMDKIYN